jgi:transcriptional regulator with XRE-family HTH domain
MEMNVNSKFIVENRKSKAWSQQQLADISGLSLRTIQRIENTGRGSFDSIKAIASAFDLTPDTIMERQVETNTVGISGKIGRGVGLFSTFLAACLIYTSFVNAEPIMLEISVESNMFEKRNVHLLDGVGKNTGLEIEDKFRVDFTPELTDERQIRLSITAYELHQGLPPVRLGSPVVITDNKVAARVEFVTESGASYGLNIVPQI